VEGEAGWSLFYGEVATNVLEYCRIWSGRILKGSIQNKHVLVAIDVSKNVLQAVDHAGFMLS